MSKIFLITNQLDTEKLNEEITRFVKEHNHEPYIFVNSATLNDLKKLNGHDLVIITNKEMTMCQGYKTFEDNTLSFGQVELR